MTPNDFTVPYKRLIRHPGFSTTCFPCPTCNAMIDYWCHGVKNPRGAETPICDARKALYIKAYNRYVAAVEAGRINPEMLSHPYHAKKVETIVKEVIQTHG